MKNKDANPWIKMKTAEYEAHMGHPNVAQIQMINIIIKEQLELINEKKRSSSSVAILGITDGNGLEYIDELNFALAIGIDINQDFLDTCQSKFNYLNNRLQLRNIDLMTEKERTVDTLKDVDLIIANLLIEHIHLDNFVEIMCNLPKHNQALSCVIQYNPDGALASISGNEHVFDPILPIIEEADEQSVVRSLQIIGYQFT